jgi:sterol desaturase/sphingolipid hydroxylase (fatty acid hydroxylase superfamily)
MALLPLVPISGILAAEWAQRHNIGLLNLLDGSWWMFAAIATVAIRSLSGYLLHLVLHKIPLLWSIHRVHHFDTTLDVSTGLRNHPLELALVLIVGVPISIIFGLTPWALIAYEAADALFALFSHANVRVPARLDRLLRTVIVTPRWHAMHHSSYRPETDSNYGTVFTIWDRMFRSYCDPSAVYPEPLQFGLLELRDDRTSDLWWQLKSPVVGLFETPPPTAPADRSSEEGKSRSYGD